ncbi:MAG: hypothetical protein H6981_08110 [Gammaproteobacteria bacterium]|nr:hypothetical protein [Gammaproteobacteria bacterium]MCP5136749.1 hypothetical protein [Gammaproteobacteria bacterium]
MNVSRTPFRLTSWLAGLLLVALLTGCGYHLRGAIDLPQYMDRVYIESDTRDKEFLLELKKVLQLSGAEVVNTADSNASILRIISVDQQRATSGHDGNRNAAQYRIGLAVTFSTTSSTTKVTTPQMSAQTSQIFNYDPAQPVQMERQERTLFQQMSTNVSQQMLRQIAKAR